MARGYIYQSGVDDAESECGLDETDHDLTCLNDSEFDDGFKQLMIDLKSIMAADHWGRDECNTKIES